MAEVKPFRFKKFIVHQDKVSMKVGTDGVLVGAWVDIKNKSTALDIGTGSGVIALILAQRIGADAKIHAIDLDAVAIDQAEHNFILSPWSSQMHIHHDSIQHFAKATHLKFDLIISNPPFFTGGMLSEHNDRNDVRHTIKLPHGDLLLAVDKLLHPSGSLAIILPYLQGLRFIEIAALYRLFPGRITEVKTKSDKPIERLLIEFYRVEVTTITDELIIQNDILEYTDNYKMLTKDFYLNF